ncbi:MAG: hypothetical protein ABJ011_05150, partial [Nitratireductor sp.]
RTEAGYRRATIDAGGASLDKLRPVDATMAMALRGPPERRVEPGARRHACPGEGEAGLLLANALRHDVGTGLRFRERQNGASAGRNDRRRELRRAVLSAARAVGAIATGDPFPD